MARAGDVLRNPVTGHEYRILQAAADTGGAGRPPLHLHPLELALLVRAFDAETRLPRPPRPARSSPRWQRSHDCAGAVCRATARDGA